MAFSDDFQLLSDQEFVGRVTIAIVNAALGVMAENKTVAGHDLRVAFAEQILRAPDQMTNVVIFGIVAGQGFTKNVSDAALTARINAIFNLYSRV